MLRCAALTLSAMQGFFLGPSRHTTLGLTLRLWKLSARSQCARCVGFWPKSGVAVLRTRLVAYFSMSWPAASIGLSVCPTLGKIIWSLFNWSLFCLRLQLTKLEKDELEKGAVLSGEVLATISNARLVSELDHEKAAAFTWDPGIKNWSSVCALIDSLNSFWLILRSVGF